MKSLLRKTKFVLLWLAIVALFAGFGALASDSYETASGAMCVGSLGFCLATSGVPSLMVILKVRAQRLTKWMAALIALGGSAAAALIPPVLMGLSGLFHGESGMVVYFEAILGFWIAFGMFLICSAVLLCLPGKAGAGTRVSRWLIVGLASVVIAGFALSPIRVGRRVTAIDLSRLYPKIDDYYEGRKGFVQRAGAYPSIAGGDYFSFPSTNGLVIVQVMLDDLDGWVRNLQAERKAETSRPIGERAFFGDWRHVGNGRLELAYRRLNVSAVFRFDDTPWSKTNVIATGQFKADLEDNALLLDQAIISGNPCIQFEDLRLGQVVGQRVQNLPGILFRFYSLLSPRSGRPR